MIIGSGAKLHLADFFDNANRIDIGWGAAEALYVDTLTFADASGILNLNGLHLYYANLVGDISQIIDEEAPLLGEPIPEPATIALLGIGLFGLGANYLRRARKRCQITDLRR